MSSSKLSFLHQAAYLPMERGGGRRSPSDLGVVCACPRPPSRLRWETVRMGSISSELPRPTTRLPSRLPYPPSLLPNGPKPWTRTYTQEFFGAPVEDVLSRLFSDRPKKASAPHPQGSRPLRKTEAVAAATTGKKSIVAQKDKPAGRAVLIKRPRQEAEPAVEPSPPAKRVKQMAKKGAREIHVISSHTTTPSASSSAAGHSGVEKQPASAADTTPVRPASVAGASVVPPSVEKAPVPQQAVSTTEGTSTKNPKPSVLVLDESEGSDEVPLAHRPHTRRQPPPIPEMAVQTGPSSANRGKRTVEEPIPVPEMAVQTGPSPANRGKRPVEEPILVAEPLVPSQDQGVPASSEAAAPVGPSVADRGKRLLEEPRLRRNRRSIPKTKASIFLHRRLPRPLLHGRLNSKSPPLQHDCRVRPFGRSD
nr:uncharacterized protein LOC114820445 [Malus domestica]